jgi:hypothetical protein
MAREARDAGLVWMSPVAPQVMKPKNAYFLEAGNSELYRKMWKATIAGDANWVHLISWNDYSEHSVIHPSAPTGYGFYDLTAYYTRWFKTGSRPQIKRDAIYSFYRIHPVGAKPNPLVQTRVIEPGSASDTPRNRVEMLAFLTAPAVLEIKLAGNVYRQKAGAGMTSFTVPLKSGRPVFRIIRNGNVVKILRGKFIQPDIAIQDLLYHGDSSLR